MELSWFKGGDKRSLREFTPSPLGVIFYHNPPGLPAATLRGTASTVSVPSIMDVRMCV